MNNPWPKAYYRFSVTAIIQALVYFKIGRKPQSESLLVVSQVAIQKVCNFLVNNTKKVWDSFIITALQKYNIHTDD